MALQVADSWYDTRTFSNSITLIWEKFISTNVRCNIWHVRGRDRDLLVDSGMGFKPLRDEVKSLTEREILAVVSHAHFDHIGSHHEFEHRLAHLGDAEILVDMNDDKTVWSGYKNEHTLDALPYTGYDIHDYKIQPAPVTRLIEEGDELDLGDRLFKVFHMPGHSPGSVCLYESANKTLFTGDVLYDGELLDELYHSDKEQYMETMARLKEIPADTFHCGHYQSFGRERMLQLVDAYMNKNQSG